MTNVMIKIQLPDRPKQLTKELELELIERFKRNTNDCVWRTKFIKDAVFDIAFGKCAYSEAKLKEEGKDRQIDHFYPKLAYKEKVVEWGNMLPSLNVCNRHKGDTDPSSVAIINPLFDDPKEHLFANNGFIGYKDEIGRNTIDVFDLNNQSYLYIPRSLLLKEIGNNLIDIEPWIEKDISYFVSRLKQIMSKGTQRFAYSAVVSTFILENKKYATYKELLKKKSLWDDELCGLEKNMEFCSMRK